MSDSVYTSTTLASFRSRVRAMNLTNTVTLLVTYLIMCVVFALIAPSFVSADNLINIAGTLAVVGITSIGMTLVLISGGVDISVGSVAALSGVVTSIFWTNNILPLWLASVVGLLSGGAVGLLNGLIITRLRINPLITTLGMYSIIRGLSFVISGGQTNQLNDEGFKYIGRGSIGVVPVSLLLMLVLYLVFIFVLRRTVFGRNLYAIGGNAEASRLAGITVRQHLLAVYIMCGLLSALAGLIIASQLASSKPQTATGLEFTVIAAVILGGTSLAGGKGTLIGSLLGVIVLRTLDNGLVLSGVSSYYQDVARGLVLLLAVGFDQLSIRFRRAL